MKRFYSKDGNNSDVKNNSEYKIKFLVAFKDIFKNAKKKNFYWIENINVLGDKKDELFDKFTNYMMKIS